MCEIEINNGASDEDEEIHSAGFIIEEPGEENDVDDSSALTVAEKKVSGKEGKEEENE